MENTDLLPAVEDYERRQNLELTFLSSLIKEIDFQLGKSGTNITKR